MAGRKIVWTSHAESELFKILNFFTERNGSNTYSRKLFKRLKGNLKIISRNPEIGIQTKEPLVRGLIIDQFIIFYQFDNKQIVVLKLWDCSQNPDKIGYERR